MIKKLVYQVHLLQKRKGTWPDHQQVLKKTAGIPGSIPEEIAYFAALIRFPIIHLPPL